MSVDSFQDQDDFIHTADFQAMYVLSSQLNSDTDLASANIFLSTILSFFSLSLVLILNGIQSKKHYGELEIRQNSDS